jgi:uncharacterized protein (TIGR02265 family)
MIKSYLQERTRTDFLKHMIEANGLVFDQVKAEIRTACDIDLDTSTLVPLEAFLKLLEYLHQKSYRFRTQDEVYEIIGYNTVTHYLESRFGWVLKSTSKIIGFAKSSQNFANSLKTIFPNASITVETADDTTYRVRISGIAVPPTFVKGLMAGGVTSVFGPPAKVEVLVYSAKHFTCQCWLPS